MVKIGEKARDYLDRRGDEDEVWIKGFKDPSTRLRFVQPVDDWTTYREHYEENAGYFGCSEESDCVGCNDTSERTRQRPRKYAFNAYDERGRLNAYRVGSKLYRLLQGREQRLNAMAAEAGVALPYLTDRDYTIIRMGQKLDTTYDVEPGDKYEIPMPEASEMHDIPEILTAKYLEVAEAYGVETGPDADVGSGRTGEEDRDPWDPENEPEKAAPISGRIPVGNKEGGGRINPGGGDTPAPAKKAAAKKAAAKKPVTAEPDEQPDETPGPNGDSADKARFEGMELPELREWLTDHDVEFPPRAPRSRLVKMAVDRANIPDY